jgi:hypothetical protein
MQKIKSKLLAFWAFIVVIFGLEENLNDEVIAYSLITKTNNRIRKDATRMTKLLVKNQNELAKLMEVGLCLTDKQNEILSERRLKRKLIVEEIDKLQHQISEAKELDVYHLEWELILYCSIRQLINHDNDTINILEELIP